MNKPVSIESHIIENLKTAHGKWRGSLIATSGLSQKQSIEAFSILRTLADEGVIEHRKAVYGEIRADEYRYVPQWKPQLRIVK